MRRDRAGYLTSRKIRVALDPCFKPIRSEVFVDQAGPNTYREGFEAKPYGSEPKPCGVDSKTSGFALKLIRFALPACGLRSLPHGCEWERIRNHAWTDVFGSFPCGNELLPHRNDLHQTVWNQRGAAMRDFVT